MFWSLGRGVARTIGRVRWYVRELMGDTKYERYAAHQRRTHPGAPLMTEREFWRDHYAAQDRNPGSRCC